MLLQPGTTQLPEDDHRTEICRSELKGFNAKFYVCGLVATLIKWVKCVPSSVKKGVFMLRNQREKGLEKNTVGKMQNKLKGKGKVIPLQARCGPEDGQRYSSTLP